MDATLLTLLKDAIQSLCHREIQTKQSRRICLEARMFFLASWRFRTTGGLPAAYLQHVGRLADQERPQ